MAGHLNISKWHIPNNKIIFELKCIEDNLVARNLEITEKINRY